ncbi:hypothetical protein DE146DRAFT_615462 [Phaeosphaeria sp. MPI-PUGE-AT-0046c]|nr:hypothetical protein DE146DRAFT_615462 [Phaeosphaeria sp. MPI-PUGE-AT-0046c]
MSSRISTPTLEERSTKRRKTESRATHSIRPFATMTSEQNKFQLELTEVESKLRQLLLDVAAYIDETPAKEDITGVHVPEELAEQKIILRWTGGWVRDKLLRVGSHDIDLAINKMTGEHFGLKMQEYLEIPGNAEKHGLLSKDDKSNAQDKSKRIAPGLHKIEANPEKSKNLETATTRIMGIDLDLVNLRKETYNEVSRNPEMEFGTAEEDAMRRDATVNAMFYNLHTCQVEDFTQRGHDDMAAKIIRTPLEPTQTFKDDPLRVLRLIRFASRLDYVIEPETAKAMGNPEIQDVLKIKISRERVGIELEKMLKGPRPRMALDFIKRFGLYRTVFTDPTRELPSEADTDLFQPAYELVQSRPLITAYLVAREGFKAPNRVCDVVAASIGNSEKIQNLVAQCAKGLRRPDTVNPEHNPTGRDTLGMALRSWGATWRAQVFFNLMYEVVLGTISREEIMRTYAAFLSHLTKLEILNVDTFKPLLKGTDLAKALGVKPGPWMKDALDIVMAWQLRNPGSQDADAAIEAVRASRENQTDSELPSRLASHFLQLTIPPFFLQNKSKLNALEASRQPAPWKDPGARYVLELLEWSISALSWGEKENKWHLLVPPILRMIDDMDAEWKAKGCHMLGILLESMRLSSVTPGQPKHAGNRRDPVDFLQRTGYHNVFAEALFPLFSYVPTLTPEAEAVLVFREVLPTLTSLALLLPVESSKGSTRIEMLDKVVREGILAPLANFRTPWTYPELATVIVSRLQVLLGHLGIESVKHLPRVITLLSATLQEPFIVSHKALTLSTLQTLRTLMQNTWPRIPGHRGAIMMGLCLCWSRCMEDSSSLDYIEEVKAELLESVEMLDAVMQAVEDASLRTLWESEKRDVVEASPACKELFEVPKYVVS